MSAVGLPLDDLFVLDLTAARGGPTAVRPLADRGAYVVRIESPIVATPEDTRPAAASVRSVVA